jgi:chromosome segregation ATPase
LLEKANQVHGLTA